MKKFFSIVLSILLIFSVMSPVTVFAENGPYPFDPSTGIVDIYQHSSLSIMDTSTLDMKDLYPQTAVTGNPEKFAGATYDKSTNTLTLKNVKEKTAVISANEMGDDFKIKLIGYNELSLIESSSESRGASITITGNGELVLNRDRETGGLFIYAEMTPSFLKIEDTVKFKSYATTDEFYDEPESVGVYNSTVTDSSELLYLGGKVVCDKPNIQKYYVNIYEQLDAYDLEYNTLYSYDAGFIKDDVYYIGYEDYNPITFNPNGKYRLYSISYDKTLHCYVASPYADEVAIKPTGFTIISEDEPIFDEKRGYYIGEDLFADEGDKSYKPIFYPGEKEPFDLCEDKNGKKYGFYEFSYTYPDGEIESETYVYKLVKHSKFGYIAIEDTSRTSLKGLTPLKIGRKKLANCYIFSDLVINNGGSVTEPAKIKNIKANNTNQGVRITWSADSSATQYRIYRKAAGELYWKTLDTISASKTSFVDKTAKSGKKYTYTVKGYNYVGWGEANSKGTTITFYEAPIVTTKNITTGVNLKWTKIAGATKYRIYRKTAGSSEWTRIDTVKGTSFTDKTAKSGKKYYYRVKAGKSDTMSGYNVASQYFLSVPKLSSIKNTRNGVNVSWETVKGADRYKVYRKHGSNSYEYIGTTEKTYYIDYSKNSGRVYTYTVKATKNQTNSAYNKTGLKIRWVDTSSFYTPTNVKNGVKLRWHDADRVDKYYIYREVDGTNTKKQIAVLDPEELERDQYGVLMYVDKTAKDGVTYAYYMRVCYKGTFSGYTWSTGGYMTRMESVDVTSAKTTSKGIKIKWEANSHATKYVVLRKESGTDSGFKFHYFTNDASSTTFLDKDVTSGKKYYYKVQAIYDLNDGKGGWSAQGASKNATAK